MGWRKGYVYEFNGLQWIELDPALPGNRDKYLAALMDLLMDAPNGQFNTLFCLQLIAQEAFVKYLEALEITLSELTENGKTQRGSIKSQNYRAGVSGFKIDYSGDAEFNNGTFRGDIYANNGVFKGRVEADTGYFKGDVYLNIQNQVGNSYSLRGGVRAVIGGYKLSYMNWWHTDNILRIDKLATGKYEVEVVEDISTNINIVSIGFETYTETQNPPFVRTLRGRIDTEFSLAYNFSVIDNHSGYFISFELKNSSGTLVDPQKIDISFIG